MQERLKAGGPVPDIGDGVTRVGLAVTRVRTVEDGMRRLLAALGERRFPGVESVLADVKLGLSMICVEASLGFIDRNVTRPFIRRPALLGHEVPFRGYPESGVRADLSERSAPSNHADA